MESARSRSPGPLLPALGLLASCASASELAERHEQRQDLDYVDCGTASNVECRSQGPEGVDASVVTDLGTCLIDALDQGTAAKGVYASTGIDWGEAMYYFVEPDRGGGWHVRIYQDVWAYGRTHTSRHTCQGLDVVYDPSGCPFIDETGCD